MVSILDMKLKEQESVDCLLEYIKSMSCWSCLCYIAGIGDRHLKNILLNKNTGEIQHIDFDMIFENGKQLLVKETIPFRLTNTFE